MAFDPETTVVRDYARGRADIDQGLRAYMLRIYNYMGLGLGVTGAVSFAVA